MQGSSNVKLTGSKALYSSNRYANSSSKPASNKDKLGSNNGVFNSKPSNRSNNLNRYASNNSKRVSNRSNNKNRTENSNALTGRLLLTTQSSRSNNANNKLCVSNNNKYASNNNRPASNSSR